MATLRRPGRSLRRPEDINLRDPEVLWELRNRRIVVAVPLAEPMMQKLGYPRELTYAAYRVRDVRKVVVPEKALLFSPKHIKDWEDHPAAHRALEIVCYKPQSPKGPLSIYDMRLNSLFFYVHQTWAAKIVLDKNITEDDLLDQLERSAEAGLRSER